MKGVVKDAVVDRASGKRPGRLGSLVPAVAIGFAGGVLAYHVLREED